MKLLWLLMFFLPIISFAGNECEQVNKNKLLLAIHISNYLNADTTSTSEGGAYQKQILKCKKDKCKIIKNKNYLIAYEPDHPDADEHGYVNYPGISKTEERTIISSVAKVMKLAKNCENELELSVDNGASSHIISYKKGIILNDVFNFNKQNKIVSLSRLHKSGYVQTINF